MSETYTTDVPVISQNPRDYRPVIKGDGVNTDAARVITAILLWITFLTLTSYGTTYFGTKLGLQLWTSTIAGVFFGLFLLWLAIRFFLINIPETTGLYTQNLLSGSQHGYGPGFHIKFPWEQYDRANFINLRLQSSGFEPSFPAKDGPEVQYKIAIQYYPSLGGLPNYIAVSDEVINEGFLDIAGSYLSEQTNNHDAEEARGKVEEFEAGLTRAFKEETVEYRGMRGTLEQVYGIDITLSKVADAAFEETFQRIRASEAVSRKIESIARRLREEKEDLSEKDSLNAALIINGNITKQVIEAEGEGVKGLASLLLALTGQNLNEGAANVQN